MAGGRPPSGRCPGPHGLVGQLGGGDTALWRAGRPGATGAFWPLALRGLGLGDRLAACSEQGRRAHRLSAREVHPLASTVESATDRGKPRAPSDWNPPRA